MTGGVRQSAPLFDRLVAGNTPAGLEQQGQDADRFAAVEPERFSDQALRRTVQRDVAWLLNTTQFGAAVDLDGLEEVRGSVLNYGVPDLAGKTLSHRAMLGRAREIRQGLRAFEPRFDEATLIVQPVDAERENALTFAVEADIASPVHPVFVRFKTDVERDGSGVAVRE